MFISILTVHGIQIDEKFDYILVILRLELGYEKLQVSASCVD